MAEERTGLRDDEALVEAIVRGARSYARIAREQGVSRACVSHEKVRRLPFSWGTSAPSDGGCPNRRRRPLPRGATLRNLNSLMCGNTGVPRVFTSVYTAASQTAGNTRKAL